MSHGKNSSTLDYKFGYADTSYPATYNPTTTWGHGIRAKCRHGVEYTAGTPSGYNLTVTIH